MYISLLFSLPTLYEAWSSLVPQHLREKYPTPELPLLVCIIIITIPATITSNLVCIIIIITIPAAITSTCMYNKQYPTSELPLLVCTIVIDTVLMCVLLIIQCSYITHYFCYIIETITYTTV